MNAPSLVCSKDISSDAPLHPNCSKCGGHFSLATVLGYSQCGYWTNTGKPRLFGRALYRCPNGHEQVGEWWADWEGNWFAENQYPKGSLISIDGEDVTKDIIGIIVAVVALFAFPWIAGIF